MKTDNELIAEFMGYTWDDGFNHLNDGLAGHKYSYYKNADGLTLLPNRDGLYQQWNGLMPVVEKIESLDVKFKIDGVRVLVVSKQLQYYWNGGMVSEPKIICVYHGCVQFIKWYNSQAEYKR